MLVSVIHMYMYSCPVSRALLTSQARRSRCSWARCKRSTILRPRRRSRAGSRGAGRARDAGGGGRGQSGSRIPDYFDVHTLARTSISPLHLLRSQTATSCNRHYTSAGFLLHATARSFLSPKKRHHSSSRVCTIHRHFIRHLVARPCGARRRSLSSAHTIPHPKVVRLRKHTRPRADRRLIPFNLVLPSSRRSCMNMNEYSSEL